MTLLDGAFVLVLSGLAAARIARWTGVAESRVVVVVAAEYGLVPLGIIALAGIFRDDVATDAPLWRLAIVVVLAAWDVAAHLTRVTIDWWRR